jgi:hypothetical protein
MAAKTTDPTAGRGPDGGVRFSVPFDGEPPTDVEIVAYAFDRAGNFLASGALSGGEVTLPISAEQAERARLFIGPALAEEGQRRPTVDLMRRLNAYEPAWRFDPQAGAQTILPILPRDWQRWRWCHCRIRGRVVRPVSIGGTVQQLPVCHARVHVCEVDRLPWLIRRLPDDLIHRLRDELLRELARPFPIPRPDPGPLHLDPGLVDPSPENIALRADLARLSTGTVMAARASVARSRGGEAVGFNPQPDPPLARSGLASRLEAVALNPQPLPPRLAALSLDPEVLGALASPSTQLLRETLIAHPELIRPYLCLWPWLWWRYRCDEIAVLETTADGRFDTTYWYLCGDRPDLYFWVEYQIGGVWTTVYRPALACHTYWEYACGTEVVISVTDPRVPACGEPADLPGLQVVVMSIGENVSLHEIQHASAGASEGLTADGAPFGGVLEPRVQFSRSALIAAGITHYRWSYHRLTLSDGTSPASDPEWHHLDHRVLRHYMVVDPNPPHTPSFPTEQMGPDPALPGLDLFRIQPLAPSVPSDGWVTVDSHEDNASAFFLTHLLAGGDAEAGAGKYELKLELFRSDGTRVNLTDAGVALSVADIDAPFGGATVTTVPASPEQLIIEAGKVVAFRMVVRVDNNVCHGDIHDAMIGAAAAGPCGFLEYPPGGAAGTLVRLSFLASHPHGFATFEFDVARGSAGTVGAASASGAVGVPANGYVPVADVFSKDLSVATLLTDPPTSPPCTRGAFAEHLHVYAMATDGWTRLTYLDAPRTGENGLEAFALAPAN